MTVHVLDHLCVGSNVFVIPQRVRGQRCVVGARVDRAVLGAHHAPAALGLGLAHGCHAVGPVVSHAGAVGHLVEAVRRRYGSDLYGLEEDVVAGDLRSWMPRFVCGSWVSSLRGRNRPSDRTSLSSSAGRSREACREHGREEGAAGVLDALEIETFRAAESLGPRLEQVEEGRAQCVGVLLWLRDFAEESDRLLKLGDLVRRANPVEVCPSAGLAPEGVPDVQVEPNCIRPDRKWPR